VVAQTAVIRWPKFIVERSESGKGGIMSTRRSHVTVASLLVVAALLAGCAKRPATTQASAPAPTGAVGTTAAGRASDSGRTSTDSGTQPTQPGGAGAQPGTTGTAGPTPGTAGAQTPGTTARPAPREFVAVADLTDVFFDFDKYDIRPNDAGVLDTNAQWLKSNPQQLVLIEGHCDERGTNEYNLALGERRAKSAMNYLVSQGVQANRITIISYGEERPSCTEKTEQCWGKNRRAHFLVKPR
jgi:peptidoglycan-associated lipoprotein